MVTLKVIYKLQQCLQLCLNSLITHLCKFIHYIEEKDTPCPQTIYINPPLLLWCCMVIVKLIKSVSENMHDHLQADDSR